MYGASMVIGFIFIKTHAKMEVKAYRELEKIPEVKELTPLFGDFDLIAKVEAKDLRTLSFLVMAKIRMVPGVIETDTLPGVEI